LAKLASDLSKPDGLKVIEPHEARAVLDPLPVSVIFGVGPRTAKRLEALGVRTVRDLADLPREEVLARFGAAGAWIHDLAHGEDPRRVSPRREEKSFSQERTFARDVGDRAELRRRLHEFCEELGYRLRSHGLRARTVAVKARFADFRTVTRTATLEVSTHLGVRLYAAARELFERVPAAPLRLLGVQVSGLDDLRTPRQADLFPSGEPGSEREPKGDREERLERLNAGLDRVRAKHGAPPAVPASLLERSSPSPSARV
jgi:DNA polymerase-4